MICCADTVLVCANARAPPEEGTDIDVDISSLFLKKKNNKGLMPKMMALMHPFSIAE